MTVQLTKSATAKAIALVEKENEVDLFLRIKVSAGGCSGFRYSLFFDNVSTDDDIKETFTTQDNSSILVCIDAMSAPYLEGASVDFVDTIEKQGFVIDNPNAHGSCACGDSFD